MSHGKDVFSVNTYCNPDKNIWSSLCSFRTTHNSWITQHLVSNNPLGSRATMLSEQAVRIHGNMDISLQNWFQPKNKYANKIFGSIVQSIGDRYSVVNTFDYLKIPLSIINQDEFLMGSVSLEPWYSTLRKHLLSLASLVRGEVYARAEELDHPDVLLDGLNEKYHEIGLCRYRRIWFAFSNKTQEPLACIIAYRGPLGMNFSFLENRIDLLVHPSATIKEAEGAVKSLIWAIAGLYKDFPPAALYVATDQRSSTILQNAGATCIRQYSQSIWVREGFEAWYQHVERKFRIVQIAEARRKEKELQAGRVLTGL